MVRDIDAPNEEMATQGVGIFAGGLKPIARAQSLRLAVDGETFLIKEPVQVQGNTSTASGAARLPLPARLNRSNALSTERYLALVQ